MTSGSSSAVLGIAPGAGSAQPARGSGGAVTDGTLSGSACTAPPAASLAPMRRSLSALRAALPVAAALVLLPACGGSDEAGSASDNTSSAPETTASAADSEFCREAASIQERLTATVTEQSDPTQLPQILDEAASEIRAIDAPEEIASDWTALADGVQRFSEAIAGIDFSDPNALTTLERELTPLQEELDTASTNVGNYLSDECGIDVDATEPAAPSS